MTALACALLVLLSGCLLVLSWEIKPFTVNFSQSDVQRMTSLASDAQLPQVPQFVGGNFTFGVELDTLEKLRGEWVSNFRWDEQQAWINRYDELLFRAMREYAILTIDSPSSFRHYTVEIENVTVHFVHAKSEDPNAIPLLMLHGWPGKPSIPRVAINILLTLSSRLFP
jgi:hypothetical protein